MSKQTKQRRLTKLQDRYAELEQKIDRVMQGAASSLAVNILIDMVGKKEFLKRLAEHQKAQQDAKEKGIRERVQKALDAGVMAKAEKVGPATVIVLARDKDGGLVDIVPRLITQQARELISGKAVGDEVEGLTLAEVYDLAEGRPAAKLEAVTPEPAAEPVAQAEG